MHFNFQLSLSFKTHCSTMVVKIKTYKTYVQKLQWNELNRGNQTLIDRSQFASTTKASDFDSSLANQKPVTTLKSDFSSSLANQKREPLLFQTVCGPG